MMVKCEIQWSNIEMLDIKIKYPILITRFLGSNCFSQKVWEKLV